MSIIRSLFNLLGRILARLLGGAASSPPSTPYIQPTAPAKPPIQQQHKRDQADEQAAPPPAPIRPPVPITPPSPAPMPMPQPAPAVKPAPVIDDGLFDPKEDVYGSKPDHPPAAPSSSPPPKPERGSGGMSAGPTFGSHAKPSADKPAADLPPSAGDEPPQTLSDEAEESGAKSADEPTPTRSEPETVPESAPPIRRDADEAVAPPHATPIRFSTYYPKEVKREDWQPVHAYVFKEAAADAVQSDAQTQLGEAIAAFRAVGARAISAVNEGALISATPDLPGFEFNPPMASIRFRKDWHRFDFEAQALPDAPLNQAANGRITFMVEGIIVAELPLAIFVAETVAIAPVVSKSEGDAYRAVFCSYSHKDTQIAERVETVLKLMGDDYLRDVMSLRSGEDWREGLKVLIDRADVFQLFWSHAAAESSHVRSEWEYALTQMGKKPKFIRPVYWEKDPNPPFPAELKHLHFAFEPKLVDWKTG